MNSEASEISHLLLKSLLQAPLLIGDLPQASSFSRALLESPLELPLLNCQQKLGHLYEDALAALLRSSPKVNLLAQNLQIQKDIHTTLGELDFLIQHNSKVIHLELATKFYLAVETSEGIILPGPDARDSYERKLARLQEHQLSLTVRHREYLPAAYRELTIHPQQLIYGCLFDHIDAETLSAPALVAPDCRRGRWLYLHECAAYFPSDTHFKMIPKSLWPVPFPLLQNHPLPPWSPPETLERIVMIQSHSDPTPYFIAPPTYPDSHF